MLDDIFNNFMSSQGAGDYEKAKALLIWLDNRDLLCKSRWFNTVPVGKHLDTTVPEMENLLEDIKQEQKEARTAAHWLEGMILLKEKHNVQPK